MTADAATEVVMFGRAGAYRILQNLFGNEPTQESIRMFTDERGRAVLCRFSAASQEYRQALEAVYQAIDKGLADEKAFLDELAVSFTRLFIGPGALEVPPWESVYLSEDDVLLQPSTLDVRRAYVEQGMIPSAYPKVADDHIGIELDFMASLAQKMADMYASGEMQAAKSLLAASRMFLDEHLLRWVAAFAEKLAVAKHGSLYSQAAGLLVGFLRLDRQIVDEIGAAL